MGTGSGSGIASLPNGCIQIAVTGYISGVWDYGSGNSACVVITTLYVALADPSPLTCSNLKLI